MVIQAAVVQSEPDTGLALSGNVLGDKRVGQGVQIEEIGRIKDDSLWRRYGRARGSGRWTARKDAAEQLELIFNEPSSVGIEISDEFWARSMNRCI